MDPTHRLPASPLPTRRGGRDHAPAEPVAGPALPVAGHDGPRRVARAVPAGSAQAVMLQVIREALDPGWTPLAAARRLLEEVQGDLLALRGARTRLRAAAADRVSVSQARALATLNIAIADLEDTATS